MAAFIPVLLFLVNCNALPRPNKNRTSPITISPAAISASIATITDAGSYHKYWQVRRVKTIKFMLQHTVMHQRATQQIVTTPSFMVHSKHNQPFGKPAAVS
ncbi:Hypothetical predicted protein [Podarcis lilfordi]|uniref:Secreted protein n=1 Tax=Podarcis lilfordi TaxID=74358 RepID=A0AA35KUL7_9SAUR|nr:Hypothetical predicted protein [Podarcis lilfordi]